MIKIKLISKKDQGLFKKGDTVRIVEVESDFNIESLSTYYDFEVEPLILK